MRLLGSTDYSSLELRRGGQTEHPTEALLAWQGTGMKAHEQDAGEASFARPCGCIVSKPTARFPGNRVLIEKCSVAQELWAALIRARDAMEEGEGRSKRAAHKRRIDAFADARETYHDHVFGEGAWRNARR